MKSVYTILRGMIKRGYLMSDLSTTLFIDKHNQKPYTKENKGSEMTDHKTNLRQSQG